MLNEKCFSKGHITDFAILMSETQMLSAQEKQLVLSHISSCDDCMQIYLDSLDESMLLEPPKDLENSILDIVRCEISTKKNTKIIAIQFVKLAIAVCLTMVLFFGGAYTLSKGGHTQIQNDISGIYQQQTNIKEDIPNDKPQSEKRRGFFDGIADEFNSAFFDFASKINFGFKGDIKNGTK